MKKCDLTISKDVTLNTGNYSSIKPSVSVTIKDIDQDKLYDEYTKLSEVLDAMIALETISLGNEMESFSSTGYKEYVRNLEQSREKIESIVEEYSQNCLFSV